jgi:hypothetical protein
MNIQIITRSLRGSLEEVVIDYPDLTWNKVFCGLNRLSQGGDKPV